MGQLKSTENLSAIQLKEQGSAPSTPSSGFGKVYCKSDGLYFIGDDGVEIGPFTASAGTGLDPSGWEQTEAMTYVSVDDPTGVVDLTGDVRANYSAGMRIKFTNGGNTIFGIITDVNQTLQSGNTRITFLHEIDPSDSQALYLMANSAITNPYYSACKAPLGFPLDPKKWTVEVTDTGTQRKQDNPEAGTWYNVGTTTGQLVVPIGAWILSYKTTAYVYSASTVAVQDVYVTLSTANNSESDADFTQFNVVYGYATNVTRYCHVPAFVSKPVVVASKTTYYLNVKTPSASQAEIGRNDWATSDKTVLRAICAYL